VTPTDVAPHADRPLRIGVDARELQGRPTGVGRYLRNLVRGLTEERGDTVVAYVVGEPPPDRVLEHPLVEVRPLRRMRPGLAWQQLSLPPSVRVNHLDVFFAPAYTCPWFLGIPCVTTVHDLSFFALPEDFAWRDGVRRRLTVAASIRASARVIAVSDFTRREIVSRFPDAADRVVTIPHGADDDLPRPPPAREEARARLGLRGPLVLTVGTVFGRRRLPVLLRATSRLRPRFPGLRLDIVGDVRAHPPFDGPALARRLGLEDCVSFSGFVDEAGLADRYASADAAVFLSAYEGFGLPALEAMSRGVPVVVSDRPALNEIFGTAALVAPLEDEQAIADAIGRLLTDETLRVTRVHRGRNLAARHSWTVTARRTHEVLLAAASER
jgi:glycosyltransferase involved in cell wall biosynthesis